jgi:hypothetical protein
LINPKADFVYAEVKGKITLPDGRVFESYDKPMFFEVGKVIKPLGKNFSVCSLPVSFDLDGTIIDGLSSVSFYVYNFSIPAGDCRNTQTWRHQPIIDNQCPNTTAVINSRVKDGSLTKFSGHTDIGPNSQCHRDYCAQSSSYQHAFGSTIDEVRLDIFNDDTGDLTLCGDPEVFIFTGEI